MAQRADDTDSTDDDLPPLEDMTEYVEKAKKLKKHLNKDATKPARAKASDGNPERPSTKDVSPSFGGLKKGFLFSSSGDGTQVKAKPQSAGDASGPGAGREGQSDGAVLERGGEEDMPFIRANGGGGRKGDGLAFPEVQDAMKQSLPHLQNQDWITDDLLSKIARHPTLSKVFQDPQLKEVLSKFHTDPDAVVAATKQNPELQAFLKDFCALMGEHFTDLGEKEDERRRGAARRERRGERPRRQAAPLISELPLSSAEEAKVREMIERPEVKAVLTDPEVKKLIVLLKVDPDSAQKMMRTATPEFHKKVHVLVENGILAVQAL